ncbi:hypothetical protein DIPPA_13569, partial [Diplonema papillatum]
MPGQAAPAAGRSAGAAASAGPVPLPRSFAEALRRSPPAAAAVDAAAADDAAAAADDAAADPRARVHPAQPAREGEVCRDFNFRRAGCRRVQCRYVHRLLPVCPAFQRGRCRDARCPNRHPRPGQHRHGRATAKAFRPFADDDLPEGPLLPQVLAARREVRRAQERAGELEAQLLREFNSWAPTPVEALCLVCGRLSTTAGEEAQHRARHRKDAVTQGRDSLVVAHVSATCASSACGGRRRGPRPSRLWVAPNRASRGPRRPSPCSEGQGEEAAFEREAPACDRVLFGSASNRTASSPASPRDEPASACVPAQGTVAARGRGGSCRRRGRPGRPRRLVRRGDPVGPAAPHREAAPVAAGAARDAADQAGSPDAIEGADRVEPAGAPAGRAGDRAADAQTAERKLRRERRRFRHAADLAASGSSAAEPFPDSDESDSDGESESGDVGGRGGGDDRDGGDRSGPGSGNGGPGGAVSLAGQPASDAPDASAEPGQPEAPSEAGLGNGSATNG